MLQVDVIIDENYAMDPTTYNLTAFTAAYNLTRAEGAKISALAGTIPLVSRFQSLRSTLPG